MSGKDMFEQCKSCSVRKDCYDSVVPGSVVCKENRVRFEKTHGDKSRERKCRIVGRLYRRTDMLEKILEEIDVYIEEYHKPPYGIEVEGTVELLQKCQDIIRKHTNGGWIPCEERLPEVDADIDETIEDYECPKCQEYNVTIRGASEATTLKYSPEGDWFDCNGYVYDVIAWQPLPESYRPEKGAEE